MSDVTIKPKEMSPMEALTAFLEKEVDAYTYGTGSVDASPMTYDDRFDESVVLKTYNDYCELKEKGDTGYNSSKFSEYFKDAMYEHYFIDNWEWENDLVEPLIQQIETDLERQSQELQETYKLFADEHTIYEILEVGGYQGINIDFEGFLNKDYKFNFIFATPNERNLDMGAIPDLWGGNLDYSSLQEETVDNALTYLIHQQGHTLAEVLQGDDNTFVKSVADELDNYPYYNMGGITACVAMSGQNLLDVLDAISSGTGCIELSKETTMGIFDSWSGAGSVLEITPEKPVVIPTSMVYTVQLEGAGRENNYGYGYTVYETYGLVGSCWTNGSIKVTDEQPVLREESLEDIKKAFIDKFEEQETDRIIEMERD